MVPPRGSGTRLRRLLSCLAISALASCGGGGGDGGTSSSGIGVAASTPSSGDRNAPSVSIVSPAATGSFEQTRFLSLAGDATTALSGTARDDVGIVEATWSTNRGASGTLTIGANGAWSLASMPLQPGANAIVISARDAAGNTGRDALTIDHAASPGAAADCASWYASGFTAVTGTLEGRPVRSAPKPIKGQRFRDPVFGTCIVRVTDHANEPPAGFARNDYSRRQAFNADDTRLLVYALDGNWHLYDARTLRWIRQLPQLAGDAEPQWDPVDPERLWFVPAVGSLQLAQLELTSGTVRTAGNFRGRLPWPTAAHVWTRAEGSPSTDGRYWCFMVDDAQFRSVGLFTWDRVTDTITGTFDTRGNRPDHVSASPSGNWCVVSWGKPDGTVAFDRSFGNRRQVNTTTEHSDLALDRNGEDVYVSIDYDRDLAGSLYMVNLRSGGRTNLFATYVDASVSAFHISGKAYARPGWVLLSSYASSGPKRWPHERIFAVSLEANPTILHLAHHHVAYTTYFTEPHASVNRDFTRIIFNSNWERASEDVDAYLIEIPPSLLRR